MFRRAMLPAMRAAVTGQGEEEGAVAGGNNQTSSPPWFVVRNHALGNNPCYAYDACIASHLGDDLDILTWEQVRTSVCDCLFHFLARLTLSVLLTAISRCSR